MVLIEKGFIRYVGRYSWRAVQQQLYNNLISPITTYSGLRYSRLTRYFTLIYCHVLHDMSYNSSPCLFGFMIHGPNIGLFQLSISWNSIIDLFIIRNNLHFPIWMVHLFLSRLVNHSIVYQRPDTMSDIWLYFLNRFLNTSFIILYFFNRHMVCSITILFFL